MAALAGVGSLVIVLIFGVHSRIIHGVLVGMLLGIGNWVVGSAFTIRVRRRMGLGVLVRIGIIGVILGGSCSMFFDVRNLIIVVAFVGSSRMFVALGVIMWLMLIAFIFMS